MAETFNCPTCGAPLDYWEGETTVHCSFCNKPVPIPKSLPVSEDASDKNPPSSEVLKLEEVKEIMRLMQADKKLEAIKRFRQLTGADLNEAKTAVEILQRLENGELDSHPEVETLVLDAITKPDPASSVPEPPVVEKKSGILATIGLGFLFLGISLIFPLVFLPLAYESFGVGDWGGFIGSMVGVLVWFLAWGSIGAVILFSGFSAFFSRIRRKDSDR